LAAVTFTFDAEGCDLNSLDGYQQLCQSAAVSKGAHGVFPTDGVFQFCGDSGRGVCFSLLAVGCLAPQLSVSDHREDISVGLRRDCFQVVVPLSFRWSPWDPGGRTHATSSCGWCLPSGSHTIKILSLFIRLRIIK
jgi:hypothetical protein